MKQNNTFYILRDKKIGFIPNYGYNLSTGEFEQQNGNCCFEKQQAADRLIIPSYLIHYRNYRIFFWDKNDNFLGTTHIETGIAETFSIDYKISPTVQYIAIVLMSTNVSSNSQFLDEQIGYIVEPHYKQLKKQYKKESGQVFFRESLNGEISLFGDDYNVVKNASISETLYFNVYTDDTLIATSVFNKSDCTLNDFRKSVKLKLSYNDKYTKILDALENTYDLIKLAPAITPLTLTKRCVMQIYIQGENTISSYAGGTYWESEVDTVVDDANELERHYYFSKGPKYVEVNLTGFNYDINATYRGLNDSDVWNSVSKIIIDGRVYTLPCSIKFKKVLNAGDVVGDGISVLLLSTGQGNGLTPYSGSYQCLYDTYQIEIYNNLNATGNLLYKSEYLYGKDSSFTLSSGYGLYKMNAVEQPLSQRAPSPSTFNLGEYVVEYQLWARIICDSDNGTYDLPYDDFAASRNNYKKCIGLSGFDSANSIVKIIHTEQTSQEPTPFGVNDYGEYFITPSNLYYYYPLAKSSWANTSIWIRFDTEQAFENQNSNYYKTYTVKDCYHIGDVIKSILSAIDKSIKHDKTAEYSSFLYGHSGATASNLNNCDLYITQKTNILKGEYDQAAQKAEIKLKQITDMLRDCFRCYWFIDEQNRFRIEHISYFMNGLSYNMPTVQLDLTSKFDKFNNKCVIYDQEIVEYEKAQLVSRYEFAYMDEVTKAMGGDLVVEVNDAYIPKDKTQEINIDGFTADIDYMLFLPDDFSQDGFALMLADNNKKVPIVQQTIKDEKQNQSFNVWVQNWYASFNKLIWHYMLDISGYDLNYNNLDFLRADNISRFMKQNIRMSTTLNIDLYKIILTTQQNYGYIEEKSIDIDTNTTEIELRFLPS